jgi:ribosomal protein S13
MARIAGINIPPHKHTEVGLTSIFGIGRTRARKICEACGIDYAKKIKDLSDADLEKIRDHIDGHWLLPRFPPSPRSAHAWSAYPYQCTYPQGPP